MLRSQRSTGHWNLQGSDIVSGHVVFAATLVVVIDDILPNVVIGTGVFDVRFLTTREYDEY